MIGAKQASVDNTNIDGDATHRPKLGTLDRSALDNMNITHHFQNDSKMSIQAGVV